MGIQLLGFGSVACWTALTITIAFFIIKAVVGLRVSREEEITGLDATEHGLPSAYAGFAMAPEYIEEGEEGEAVVTGDTPIEAAVEVRGAAGAGSVATAPVMVTGDVPAAEAIPVTKMPTFASDGHKYTKIEIICKEARFEALKTAMMKLGITGMTVSHVLGCGMQKGKPEYYRGVQIEANLLPKIQVDVVVSKVPVRDVIETAKKVLYTGHIGDGKIFVYDVENVVKVRTGEEGFDALQDVE